jgi:hypothetical protein
VTTTITTSKRSTANPSTAEDADSGRNYRCRASRVAARTALQKHGIEDVILEQRSGEYVLSRVRAGLIEEGTAGRLAGHPQRDAASLARADLRQP